LGYVAQGFGGPDALPLT